MRFVAFINGIIYWFFISHFPFLPNMQYFIYLFINLLSTHLLSCRVLFTFTMLPLFQPLNRRSESYINFLFFFYSLKIVLAPIRFSSTLTDKLGGLHCYWCCCIWFYLREFYEHFVFGLIDVVDLLLLFRLLSLRQ